MTSLDAPLIQLLLPFAVAIGLRLLGAESALALLIGAVTGLIPVWGSSPDRIASYITHVLGSSGTSDNVAGLNYALAGLSFAALALFGALAARAGLAERMCEVWLAIFGHLRGGRGIASILAGWSSSAAFGSSAQSLRSVGGLMEPGLAAEGWAPRWRAAVPLMAALGGALGPFCFALVAAGLAADVSIFRLVLAAIQMGAAVALALVLLLVLAGKVFELPRGRPFSWNSAARASWNIAPDFGLFLILPLAAYLGLVTVSEGLALICWYAIILYTLQLRDFRIAELAGVVLGGARVFGRVTIQWVMASVFAQALLMSSPSLPVTLVAFSQSLGFPYVFFVAAALLCGLLALCFDAVAAVTLTIALVYPAATSMAFSPVYFLPVLVASAGIGSLPVLRELPLVARLAAADRRAAVVLVALLWLAVAAGLWYLPMWVDYQ